MSKRFSEERIIGMLRGQEAGAAVEEIVRRHGIPNGYWHAAVDWSPIRSMHPNSPRCPAPQAAEERRDSDAPKAGGTGPEQFRLSAQSGELPFVISQFPEISPISCTDTSFGAWFTPSAATSFSSDSCVFDLVSVR